MKDFNIEGLETFKTEGEIDDDTLILFAQVLQDNISLKKLYLNNKHFTSKGLGALVEVLCINHTLTHLYLGGNEIASLESLNFLKQLIEQNKSLKQLSLKDIFYRKNEETYGLEEDFLKGLLKALKNNYYLEKLDLTQDIQVMPSYFDQEAQNLFQDNYGCRLLYKGGGRALEKLNESKCKVPGLTFLKDPFHIPFLSQLDMDVDGFLNQPEGQANILLADLIDKMTAHSALEDPLERKVVYSWIVIVLVDSHIYPLDRSLTFHMQRAVSGLSNPPDYKVELGGLHDISLPKQLNCLVGSPTQFQLPEETTQAIYEEVWNSLAKRDALDPCFKDDKKDFLTLLKKGFIPPCKQFLVEDLALLQNNQSSYNNTGLKKN